VESYYKALDFLEARYSKDYNFDSVFISPLDKSELELLVSQKRLKEYVPALMLDSLKIRAQKEGKQLTKEMNQELEIRANNAIDELRIAHRYKHIVPNHCYESNIMWELKPLLGEPERVVNSIKDIANLGDSDYSFSIDDNLLQGV
jgi:hypothetical protein